MRRKGDESRENVSGQYCKPQQCLHVTHYCIGIIWRHIVRNRRDNTDRADWAVGKSSGADAYIRMMRTRENHHHTRDELLRRARWWKIKELYVYIIIYSTLRYHWQTYNMYLPTYVFVVNWKTRIRFRR